MNTKTFCSSDALRVTVEAGSTEILCRADTENAWAETTFSAKELEADDVYVLFPACCYNGNRFACLPRNYPPLFTPEEARVEMQPVITDVPRLEPDGSGRIEVTTGDVSVPCVAAFCPGAQKAFFLYTIQQVNGHNLGLCFEKGSISLQYPHHRQKVYRWPHMHNTPEPGIPFRKGSRIRIPFQWYGIPCTSMEDFYRFFFEHRHCMGLDAGRPATLPPQEQFEIQRRKFNALNWSEEGHFYGSDVIGASQFTWQPGWVGGAITTYPLMKLGGPLEWERSVQTLEHLFRTQTPSGFFSERTDAAGQILDIGFGYPGTEQWHLVRKSGDALYYLFRHFRLFQERGLAVPAAFLRGARRAADAFVRLWERYGQLGQFADLQTGELLVGGSTCGAIVPAALAEAYRWFGEQTYLDVAEKAANLYYERDALKGYTTGGPEEILQCPDSESAFALLESMVLLYEVTGNAQWLERAQYMARFAASWVVPYNYVFPQESEFHRLGMKTVGSVFANVQNKHSAPGICTLSGDSLFKLYRWTGEQAYLELCKDIALTISQYMSTEARPIRAWDVPKDAALLGEGAQTVERETLPAGYICERVNLSDWEGPRCVGGVFNGSCWCETSNLLVLADLAPLWESGRKAAPTGPVSDKS